MVESYLPFSAKDEWTHMSNRTSGPLVLYPLLNRNQKRKIVVYGMICQSLKSCSAYTVPVIGLGVYTSTRNLVPNMKVEAPFI